MTKREIVDRWFVELWERRNPQVIDEVIHPECTRAGLMAGTERGPAGIRAFYDQLTGAFKEVTFRVVDSIEDADRIAFRARGSVVTRAGVRHEFDGGVMIRFQGDQFYEVWNQWDFLSLLHSLGAIPPDAFRQALTAAATA